MNGEASPLLYLSLSQINFAVPWNSPVGAPLNVEVMRSGVHSNAVPITLASAAPSAFGQTFWTPGLFTGQNMAYMDCVGMETYPVPGQYCTIWGNGFGATNPPVGQRRAK